MNERKNRAENKIITELKNQNLSKDQASVNSLGTINNGQINIDSVKSKADFYSKIFQICLGNIVFGYNMAIINESFPAFYKSYGFFEVYSYEWFKQTIDIFFILGIIFGC